MDIEREKLIWMYRTMLKIRRFEERVATLFSEGKMPGFVHLYVGEEAVATAVSAVLRTDDYITSNHRGHGHLIGKGGDVRLMFAELYGRSTGYCKGKGGSMHIADLDLGILGANGIVGGGFPIATGAGFSALYRGTDQVVVCYFGDGSSNQSTFHEAVNLASVWKLPVIFLCENNGYGISVSQKHHQNIVDVADRAAGYGMPSIVVDGNDVLAVYEAAVEAVARARRKEGPALVECKTYRWRGHNEGDPQVYRTKEEVAEWMERDPIARFRKRLGEMGFLTDAEAEQIEQETAQIIEEAVQFAEASPLPDPEALYEDVYTVAKAE